MINPKTTEANIALAKSAYDAFSKGDVQAIVATCSADVDWAAVGRGSDFPTLGYRKGHAEVADFFRLVGEHDEFAEFTPREFHAADDKVFVLGTYTIKARRTGRTFTTEWVHVFTIRDGKTVKWREHTDTAKFAEAYHEAGR